MKEKESIETRQNYISKPNNPHQATQKKLKLPKQMKSCPSFCSEGAIRVRTPAAPALTHANGRASETKQAKDGFSARTFPFKREVSCAKQTSSSRTATFQSQTHERA